MSDEKKRIEKRCRTLTTYAHGLGRRIVGELRQAEDPAAFVVVVFDREDRAATAYATNAEAKLAAAHLRELAERLVGVCSTCGGDGEVELPASSSRGSYGRASSGPIAPCPECRPRRRALFDEDQS
jgi:hypothetical protein